MGKGKTLADLFADFFPPSTEGPATQKSDSESTVHPTVSRKIPSINQEEEKPDRPAPTEKYSDNIFDDSEALEELANKMVIREKPTPICLLNYSEAYFLHTDHVDCEIRWPTSCLPNSDSLCFEMYFWSFHWINMIQEIMLILIVCEFYGKPRGMTAREAMRAAAREAKKEQEMEDEERGIYARNRYNMGGGRPPPFIRRGGARGSGRGGGGGGRGGGRGGSFGGGGDFRGGAAGGRGAGGGRGGSAKKKRKKEKKEKKEKAAKKRDRRSIDNVMGQNLGSEDLVLVGSKRRTWSEPYSRGSPALVDTSPVRHQLRRGKGRPKHLH